MRIGYLAVLISLLVPTYAQAQYIGVAVDRVSATVDFQVPRPPAGCGNCISDESPNASRRATAGGIVLALRPERVIGFGAEALFAPRGWAVSGPTLNVNYLSFPVLARLGRFVNTRSPVAVYLEGGLAPSVRVDCSVRTNGVAEGCFNGAAFGQDWRIRRYDIATLAGVGVNVRIRGQVFALRGRGELGLLDIGGPKDYPTKHQSSSISVAWFTPLRVPRLH